MNIPEVIAQIPLFRGLPGPQIAQLARIAVYRSFHRGETIFSEGEEANGFYVVVTGRVKVFKVSTEGKEQVLHLVGSLDPFGEVPVFTGGKYPAHAVAMGETRLLFLGRTAFTALVKADPSLAMNMLALLSIRLKEFARLIEELSLKEVPGRLASYLLYLSERSGGGDEVELDVSKGIVAQSIGTIPETLSRILARMANERLIRIEGRRIVLLDRRRIEDLSSGLGNRV